MRFFYSFIEMKSEVLRDLAELSVIVKTDTYQDKDIKDNPDFFTHEQQNYCYTITSPRLVDLKPTQPWADAEFEERIFSSKNDFGLNPGEAWRLREDVWNQFRDEEGRFAYTYSERFAFNLNLFRLIAEIKVRPTSRQLYLPVWHPRDGSELGGISRVPCSLGYLFQFRQGTLNMTYMMRSCDFVTHFENDVYLARKLQEFVAKEAEMIPGLFTHFIGSLHIFAKDCENVF